MIILYVILALLIGFLLGLFHIPLLIKYYNWKKEQLK